MASRNVIANLTKVEKLDGTNYDIWHRKTQYSLNKIEVLETITNVMGNWKKVTLHNINVMLKLTKARLKKTRCTCFTMLSNIHNDIIGDFLSLHYYPKNAKSTKRLSIVIYTLGFGP